MKRLRLPLAVCVIATLTPTLIARSSTPTSPAAQSAALALMEELTSASEPAALATPEAPAPPPAPGPGRPAAHLTTAAEPADQAARRAAAAAPTPSSTFMPAEEVARLTAAAEPVGTSRIAAPAPSPDPLDAVTSAEQPDWLPAGDASGPTPTPAGCADCRADDQIEGEPLCGTDYVDNYNGGCSSTPNVFQDVECGTICGKTGTYLLSSSNVRDTDWYRITVGAGTFTYSGIADGFSLRLFVMNPVCPAQSIGTVIAASCTQSSNLTFTGPGTFYLFAAPNVFTGVPCGSTYRLTVSGPGVPVCCVLDCPPDAQIEDEPRCETDYVDNYNGGCNSTPNVFQDVRCGTICGETGTYLNGTTGFRDTDWYRITVGAGTFTYSGIASGFPLRLFVLNPVCPGSSIGTTTAPSCTQSSNLTFTGPGTFYLFAAPDVFDDVPCGSQYKLSISGPGVPVCCVAQCPPDAQVEGEPECDTNYVDAYNGGCNSTPNVFQDVQCGTICGEAGTYLNGTTGVRDTDWYRITVGAGTFTYSGIASGFPLRLFVLNPVCPGSSIGTTTAPSCTQSSNLTFNGPGTFYLFAGPDVFTGVPCGSKYLLTISGPEVPSCCVQQCPAGAQVEGEPVCGTNYVDSYNGGCNSTPNVFLPAECGTICGETGTYLSGSSNFRDTDWYRITVGPGTFTYSGTGSGFPIRLFLLDPVCPGSLIESANAPGCVAASLTFTGPGTFYLFAAPDVFSGVPCGSKYLLQISGPGIPDCGVVGIDDEIAGAPSAGPASVTVRPNPFNPATRFEYTVPRTGAVHLEVYDASGRLVRTLVDGALEAGARAVTWDGRDGDGQVVPAGIYLYALSLDNRVVATGKAVLLK